MKTLLCFWTLSWLLEKTGPSLGGTLQKKKNGNYLVFLALYRKCYLDVLLLKKKVWICCLTLGWQFWKSPERTTMDSWRDAILVTLSVWNWLMFAIHFQRDPFVPPWCARFKSIFKLVLSLFKAFSHTYLFPKSAVVDLYVVTVEQDRLVAAHECTITVAFSFNLWPSEAQT